MLLNKNQINPILTQILGIGLFTIMPLIYVPLKWSHNWVVNVLLHTSKNLKLNNILSWKLNKEDKGTSVGVVVS